jgi:putative redox protein
MATFKTVDISARMGERFRIESRIRDHVLIVDQAKAAGGEDAGPTPLEYLFLSLAGCVASIARIVANQQKLPLRSMEVRVVGELDVETLMGKAQENRAGFTGLRVITKIDADMSKDQKERFLHEVDARCPVSDNLKSLTPLYFEVES